MALRPTAALVVGLAIFLICVPASLGYKVCNEIRWNDRLILETIDYVVFNVVLSLSVRRLIAGQGRLRAKPPLVVAAGRNGAALASLVTGFNCI